MNKKIFLNRIYSDKHKYKHVQLDFNDIISSVVRISDNVLFETGDIITSNGDRTHQIDGFTEKMRQFGRGDDNLSGVLEIYVHYKNNEGGNWLCEINHYKVSNNDTYVIYPEPGQQYRHYKGGLYEVMFLSKHTETDEILVNYKSILFGSYHSRPLNIWNSVTDENERRFKLI